MVSKNRKYIDFNISGLQDRYIDLHDGLRIESPLIMPYFTFWELNPCFSESGQKMDRRFWKPAEPSFILYFHVEREINI